MSPCLSVNGALTKKRSVFNSLAKSPLCFDCNGVFNSQHHSNVKSMRIVTAMSPMDDGESNHIIPISPEAILSSSLTVGALSGKKCFLRFHLPLSFCVYQMQKVIHQTDFVCLNTILIHKPYQLQPRIKTVCFYF